MCYDVSFSLSSLAFSVHSLLPHDALPGHRVVSSLPFIDHRLSVFVFLDCRPHYLFGGFGMRLCLGFFRSPRPIGRGLSSPRLGGSRQGVGVAPLRNPRAYRRSHCVREIGMGVFLRGCAPFVAPAGRGCLSPFSAFRGKDTPCRRSRRASAKRPQKRPPNLFSRLPPGGCPFLIFF